MAPSEDRPPWRATLDVLDRALEPVAPALDTDSDHRFSWSVRDFGRLEVQLWMESRTKRGRFGSRRRVLSETILNGLLPDSPLESDRRAIAVLEAELEILAGHGSSSDRVSEGTARKIVAELAGHPRVFAPRTAAGRDDGVALEVEVDRLAVSATEDLEGSVRLEVVLERSRRPRPDLVDACTRKIPGHVIVELDEELGACRAIRVPEEARRLLHSLRGRLERFPREARLDILGRLPRLQERLPVLRDSALRGARIEARPEPILRLGPLGADSVRVFVLIRPAPGLATCPPGHGPAEMYGVSHDRRVIFTRRDLDAERQAAEALIGSIAPLAKGAAPGAHVIDVTGEDALALFAALEARPELATEWMEGTWRPRIVIAEPKHLRLAISDHRDWFGVAGGVDFGPEQLHLAALLDAVRQDRRHVRLEGGAWAAISEALLEQLQRLEDLTLDTQDGAIALGLAAPLVLDDLGAPSLATSARWRRLLERARVEGPDPAEPPPLAGRLRPYQLEGFRWLARLAELGFGACLADDMGLGKTIQAIALLSKRSEEGPALVVLPTSLAFGWARELGRHAPHLRVAEFRSVRPEARRTTIETLGPRDVVLASYELVARAVDDLERATFATLILDEAQAIKNADTDRARAIRRLDARARVALTGTPVENHVGELWSLFAALSPGLLGSWGQFRRRFLLPAERETGRARRRALAKLLRPFILRRTKGEVARELPPKTEVTLEIELSDEERRRYQETRLAALAELAEPKKKTSPGEERFVVLAAITRLRQLACDVRLVDPDWAGPTSKVEAAVALLLELKSEGHRALVFSQFTKLLDRVEVALTAADLPFVRLDGQTTPAERARRVESFQRGDATVFLLSLKAGGTGLNLTAADYVLHLDPWWNPASEDQASDRAHRIGQDKPVTVYRLVAKGTIEEEMLAVHTEKRALMGEVLEGADVAATVSTEVLLDLIRAGRAHES